MINCIKQVKKGYITTGGGSMSIGEILAVK